MQDHAADQLHIVRAQSQNSAGRFAHGRKRFWQQAVQSGSIGETLTELARHGAQLVVGKCLEPGLQQVDLGNDFAHLAQHALVAAAENARQKTVEHG